MNLPTRRVAALLTTVVGLSLGTVAIAPAALADTPQQQAATLSAQVRGLQAQTEQVTEDYDRAQGQLAIVVSQEIQAQKTVNAAQKAVDAQQQINTSTIRSVYELGGPSSLYLTVLTQGGNPNDVQSGLAAVGLVVAQGQARSTGLEAAAVKAQTAQDTAATLAQQQTALEAQVSAKAATIQTNLTRTQGLLDAANAQVRALAAQAEAARMAAQQAQFLQAVALAQQGNGSQYDDALATAPPASSPLAAVALGTAKSLEGHPYQWGGTGPIGYDCSGMTGASYAAAGLRLPRTAAQQYQAGPHVPIGDLEPGDLLFWASDPANKATIDHVAIYAGNGLMVSANHTGDTVRLQPVWWNGYAGATRPTAVAAAVVPGPVWAAGQLA